MKLSHETYPILKWEIVKLGIAASTESPSLSQEITPSGVLLSLPLSLHIYASSFEWQATSATQMQKLGTFSSSLLHQPLPPLSPQPHLITSSFQVYFLNAPSLHLHCHLPRSHCHRHSPKFLQQQTNLSLCLRPPPPTCSPVCSQRNLLKCMPLLKTLHFPLASGPSLNTYTEVFHFSPLCLCVWSSLSWEWVEQFLPHLA